MNAGNNQWLPALIYSEVGECPSGDRRQSPILFRPFKAQARCFGIVALASGFREAQEMSNMQVEAAAPPDDQDRDCQRFTRQQLQPANALGPAKPKIT